LAQTPLLRHRYRTWGLAGDAHRSRHRTFAFPMYEWAGADENWQNLQLSCGLVQVTLPLSFWWRKVHPGPYPVDSHVGQFAAPGNSIRLNCRNLLAWDLLSLDGISSLTWR
jgi:hypothetical protein